MLKSWTRHQHYNKPNPPWIKLYTSLLDDIEFQLLPEPTRLLAFHVLMLAAKTNNKMPKSPSWLKTRFALLEVDLEPLYEYGLITDYDSRTATLDKRAYAKETEQSRAEINKDGLKTAPRSIREEGLRAIGQVLPAGRR